MSHVNMSLALILLILLPMVATAAPARAQAVPSDGNFQQAVDAGALYFAPSSVSQATMEEVIVRGFVSACANKGGGLCDTEYGWGMVVREIVQSSPSCPMKILDTAWVQIEEPEPIIASDIKVLMWLEVYGYCSPQPENQRWPYLIQLWSPSQYAKAIAAPPQCPDGQYLNWEGVCVCPSGQEWNGQQCVTPTPQCPDGQYWDGSRCVCPSGQEWNGQQCVLIVCSEGAIRNVVMCPDGVNWKQREVCRNNNWVPEQQTCPLVCSEGAVKVLETCPDGSWKRRQVCRNNAWVEESQQCGPELPSIEYELPVKTDLSVIEILRGERPWLDTLYDSNLFFEADERFWDYANNAMDQPTRFMSERYRFGNLDTWLAVSNKGSVSITIDYVTVHLNPQKMHKHVSGASDIYDDNWTYSYSLDLPLKKALAPGEKTKLSLSTIPLYFADPYPYMPGSPNMMHTQTYVVHFTIYYRSSLGNQLTRDTTEFPVLAKSTIDQVFWDFVESVFTSALAAARGEAKITAQIVVDIIDDVIESLTKIFLSSDSNIVGLMDTQGKLGLRVYGKDGKQIVLSSDNVAVLEGATIARLPQELTDFRVDIDAAQARYAKENFEIKVVTVRRGLCIETTSVSGSIERGDVQTKPIHVSPDGKSIELKSTDAYQPQLSLDSHQSWLAYGVLAAVAVSIIVVYATRAKRPKGPRVKEIRSTAGRPRVKSIQETGTKPRVLKIEEE